jgi:glycosyltransferase involved in cell wall biosynthesis
MKLVFVGHEASLTGAPYTQLYLIQWLRAHTAHSIELVLLRGGALVPEFEKVAKVHILNNYIDNASFGQRFTRKLEHLTNWRTKQIFKKLRDVQPSLIFANTTITLDVAVQLKRVLQVPLLINIHELETTFYYYNAEEFQVNSKLVDFFIPGSQRVKQYYEMAFGVPTDKARVVYDYTGDSLGGITTAAQVRQQLGIPAGTRIVGAIGSLGWRKGPDLFLQVAQQVAAAGQQEARFVWVGGNPASPSFKELQYDIERMGLADSVLFVGNQSDLRGYYEAFDVLLLTSREDPFPLVCIEAGMTGCPTICFAQAGGMPEFVRSDAGFVVPYANTQAMSEKTMYLLQHESIRRDMGAQARQRAGDGHTIRTIGPQMYDIIQQFLP